MYHGLCLANRANSLPLMERKELTELNTLQQAESFCSKEELSVKQKTAV